MVFTGDTYDYYSYVAIRLILTENYSSWRPEPEVGV
jgi:hypothetical protein